MRKLKRDIDCVIFQNHGFLCLVFAHKLSLCLGEVLDLFEKCSSVILGV